MRTDVAALYVDPLGPYPKLVEHWYDEKRDARTYAGPWPVVAHPPCQLWVNFAALNFKRYGGEHNRPGNDGGCFESALTAVQRFGGVLEHPAGSNAFAAHNIPAPKGAGWNYLGAGQWICEVWQSAYGHRARKRTWLFYSGERDPLSANWLRHPGTHQCGWFDRNKPTLSKREAKATPVAFAEWLLELAANANEAKPRKAAPVVKPVTTALEFQLRRSLGDLGNKKRSR